MGGIGSGRKSYRLQCEDCFSLDIATVTKASSNTVTDFQKLRDAELVLQAWRSPDAVTCRYFVVQYGQLQTFHQTIALAHTSCTYGGKRPWFSCPKCSHRVSKLYSYGRTFACRHCYNLTYYTRSITPTARKIVRAIRLRNKLGTQGELLSPVYKPRSMHHDTHRAVAHNIRKLEHEFVMEFFGRL